MARASSQALIYAQAQRVGPWGTLAPVFAGVVIAASGLLLAPVWPQVQTMQLVDWLAQVFVVCTGICVAAAVTGDQLIELHESTETSFRVAQFLRALTATAASVVGAAAMFLPLHLGQLWPRDPGWMGLIVLAGAVVWVAAVAVVAAALSGTPSATTIAVVVAWMFLTLLWDPYVSPVLLRRGLPALAAAGLLALAWRRLGDTEHNITQAGPQ